jgi:drug/metabolite transporter (DMT)-like permease
MVDTPILPAEPGRPDQRRGLGYLMVASAAVLFAVNGTVSKVALGSGISTLELTQIRSTGAAAGLLAFLLVFARARLRVGRRELLFLVLFGVTGVAFVQWLYFVAIERLPVGIALLIQFIGPLFVALFARFVYRERIRRRIWAAHVLCNGGLACNVEVWSQSLIHK